MKLVTDAPGLAWELLPGEIRIGTPQFRILWKRHEGRWRDQIEFCAAGRWRTIARSSWHLTIRASDAAPQTFFFENVRPVQLTPRCVRLAGEVNTPIGNLEAHYQISPNGVVKIGVQFTATTDQQPLTGLECLRFEHPQGFDRVRLYDLLPGGWSDAEGSIAFSAQFLEDHPTPQMALSCLEVQSPQEQGVTCHDQGLGLSYPPAYRHGVAVLLPGEIITGDLTLSIGQADLFSSVIELVPGKPFDPPATIAPPRYPYAAYVQQWLKFAARPELWVDLGDDMGLFHRGYYGVLKEPSVSGVLHVAVDSAGRQTWQTQGDRLAELAWGGSANVMLAETALRLAQMGIWPQGLHRAQAILRAILHFQGGGFQVREGPCRGAWWNAWIVERQQFASRYGRPHVETPVQGVVNYFLYRLYRQGLIDPLIPQRIVHNCTTYLSSVEREDGSVEYARYIDGRPGENRQYEPYTQGYAVGTAMAALSWLCAWRLTGEEPYRRRAMRLLDYLVDHQIARNEWRFMEYDTTGADTAAPSAILLTLCEAIKDFPEARYIEAADRTFQLIRSLIYHVEPNLDRYRAKEAVWGGSMRIRGGIAHGSSPNSRQGMHSVHLRADFGVALDAYANQSENATAWATCIGYLNFLTWHQFLNRELSIGYGATTEHCSLKWDYIQDTAQLHCSNPLAMLGRLDSLQLIGTNAHLTHLRRVSHQLELELIPLTLQPWLAFDRSVCVRENGRIIWNGPGGRVLLPRKHKLRLLVESLTDH